jgi:DNA-binding transcriptional regulator YiaG
LDLGLSQRQVAAQIGAHVTSVRNWEGNATSPALWFMPRIIRFLGYVPWSPSRSIPEWLRTVRCNLGLSRERLARAVGVDESTVARWEAGRSKIGQKALQRLANRFAEGATTPRIASPSMPGHRKWDADRCSGLTLTDRAREGPAE